MNQRIKARRRAHEIGRKLLESAGYDGAFYENDVEGKGRSWIAFSPTQIKSKFNTGTYDPKNPKISYEQYDHKFSTTQVDLPSHLQEKFRAWIALNIKPNDLSPDEAQDDAFHVTVKYGLHTEDAEPVKALLKNVLQVNMTLGEISAFTTDPSYDVLIVKIDSPELLSLNKLLTVNLPNTATQSEYRPHATLAYLKKGLAAKWLGDDTFAGEKVVADTVKFSSAKDAVSATEIKLSKYEHYPWHRPLSKYESRVNFAKADESFSRLIASTDGKLRDVLRKAQKDLIKRVTDAIRVLNPSIAGTFRVDVGDEFYRTFRDFLLDAWREGKDQGYEELPESLQKVVRQVKTFDAHEYAKVYHGDGSHDEKSHGNWATGGGEGAGSSDSNKVGLPSGLTWKREDNSVAEAMKMTDRWRFEWTEVKGDFIRKGEVYNATVKPFIPQEMNIEEFEDRQRTAYIDKDVATWRRDGDGFLIIEPKGEYTKDFDSLMQRETSMIFRGMRYEEWESAKKDGYFQSRGGHNLGDAQVGLTYFGDNPGTASSYAGGFAPWQYAPTFGKPGVVVKIKEPTGTDRVNAPPGEVGVSGRIAMSEVLDVVELMAIGMSDGDLDIRREVSYRDDSPYIESSRLPPSTYTAYRRVPKDEQKKFTKTYAGFEPRQAIDYLTTKALVIKGLLDNELTEDVQQLLLEHLKGGRTITETIMDLREMFEPWIGDPTKIAPSGQVGVNTPPGTKSPDNVLQAYRLENMIRTPLIEAYNQGRAAIADASDGYVKAFEISAILDQRTSLICQTADGITVDIDDPRARKLFPPLHFNCRSIIVYVTIDDFPIEFSSDEDIDEAVSLIQDGFS